MEISHVKDYSLCCIHADCGCFKRLDARILDFKFDEASSKEPK